MEQFLEMITTYGAPFVITAIVLYGAFRVMNIFIGKLERSHGGKKEKEKHDALLQVRAGIDKTITSLLERVLMRTNSDRAFVFEFHNGGNNLGGLPFLKMSNTYEVVDTGIAPQRFNLEQLSCAIHGGTITEIISNTHLDMNLNDRRDEISTISYETLKAQGVHRTVVARISNARGIVIGYCGVDYVREEKDLGGNSDIQRIRELAIELGALLSVDE